MITVNFTDQYNRELFTFLGEVGNPLHQGFHDLIHSKKFQLIISSEDFVKGMGLELNPSVRESKKIIR
tara:strand:+ start:2280 stop:2483 length:204 start_codon:yes stop_codon:yes gene_type:complete